MDGLKDYQQLHGNNPDTTEDPSTDDDDEYHDTFTHQDEDQSLENIPDDPKSDRHDPSITSEGDIQASRLSSKPLRGSTGKRDISLSDSVISNAYIAPERVSSSSQVYNQSVVHHYHYYNLAGDVINTEGSMKYSGNSGAHGIDQSVKYARNARSGQTGHTEIRRIDDAGTETSVQLPQSTSKCEKVGSGTDDAPSLQPVSEREQVVSGTVAEPGHQDIGYARTMGSETLVQLPQSILKCEKVGSGTDAENPDFFESKLNDAPRHLSQPDSVTEQVLSGTVAEPAHQDIGHARTVGSDASSYVQQPASQSGQVGSETVGGASSRIQQPSVEREHAGSGAVGAQDDEVINCSLSVSSAKPGDEDCVPVKNLIFYHQSKLSLQSLFWTGEEYGGDIENVKKAYKNMGLIHEPCAALQMNAKSSGIIKVRFVSADPDAYDVVDSNLKSFVLVSDLQDNKTQILSFRVTPAPDEVRVKYLDIDYCVKIDGCAEQKATPRIENKPKDDADVEDLMRIIRKLTVSGFPINVKVGEPLNICPPADDARAAAGRT